MSLSLIYLLFIVAVAVQLVVVASSGDLPLCTDASIRLKPCANNDTYCGDWKGRVYTPNNCRYREISNEDARKCIANRTIACIGDSIIRDMCVGLAMYLSGEKVEEGPDFKFDKKAEISSHFTNATKIGDFKSWRLNKDNYNGILFPMVSNGSTTDWKWQVQIWELHCNRYLHDHHVQDVLMNKMGRENPLLRHIDFAFWGHGLHDYGWFDQHPYGQRFFDTIVKQWIKVREEVSTPVVWTPINPHCLAHDPMAASNTHREGGFERQTHMAAEGNYVTNKLLREQGLPYYDSAGPLRSPQICNISSDGVHVKMWVDLVRAQIMLNHLCDEDNNWVGDTSRF